MKNIDRINLGYKDERVRRNILPVKVIKTWGNVEGAENLLNVKLQQITTDEPEYTILENNDGSEQAAILLDFGSEINGTLRILNFLTQGEARYAEVDVKLGESATEACSTVLERGATNDHTPRDFTAIIPSFSDQEVGETGYRFACIRLKSPNTKIVIKSVYAVLVIRDIEYKGSFECNNELLNDIYNTAAYTCHLCMQRYLWDGIKRDRLVWVGDMHPELLTIKTVFGDSKVMEEAIRFARLTTPIDKWMNTLPSYNLWWLCSLWDWYFYTGDEVFFEENRDYALAMIKRMSSFINFDGTDTFDYDFLDWPTSGTKAGAAGVKGLLGLGFMAAEKIARAYGDIALADECKAKVEALRKRDISNEGAKQTAAILALSGIADEQESAEFILDGYGKGMSTFMSYYILTVAAKKSVEGALRMLKEYYGGMLSVGATTFWEDFNLEWLEGAKPIDTIIPEGEYDIHADNGGYCYKGLRHSFCHGWSSAPTAFLAETVLGVKVLEKGCKKVAIKAQLGDLLWAKGTYPTPYGEIFVSHTKNADGTVATEFTAPSEVEIILE